MSYFKKTQKSTLAAVMIIVVAIIIAGIAVLQLSRGRVLTLNGYDTPNLKEIRVRKGEKVVMNVETRTANEEWDVYITDLDQHGTLSRYSPVVLEFTPNKVGTFDIVVKKEDGPRRKVSSLIVEE